MAPHRAILVFLAVIGLPTLLTFLSLLHSHPRGNLATESASGSPKSGISAFFSFHTPSSLFPPSAIISLTDDNSTFFLARPADFGPALSTSGLSGQLWIGSGFADDDLGRVPGTGTEGELGCSDIPGWEDGSNQPSATSKRDSDNAAEKKDQEATDSNAERHSNEAVQEPSEDDGTDDHLHYPLASSSVSKQLSPGQSAQQEPVSKGHTPTHGDIQTLQESAEISGRVVLLSRGGCGFLEKVKWAQRRGGIAVIVGDQTRGGALVTMYARGDTSNVTIPSLFTSHTTAHLLSSLIPPEILDDDDQINAQDTSSRRGGKGSISKKHRSHNGDRDDKPTFTLPGVPKSTSATSFRGRRHRSAKSDMKSKDEKKSGWLRSLGYVFGIGRHSDDETLSADSRRPPSSGQLDWFSENWTEKVPSEYENSKQKEKAKDKDTSPSKDNRKSGPRPSSSDDFEIGVQDWRDPDLVASKASMRSTAKSTTQAPESTSTSSNKGGKADESDHNTMSALAGGSITPGSGEYQKPGHKIESQEKGDAKNEKHQTSSTAGNNAPTQITSSLNHMDEEHEGLWVTLTPTAMSTSPFFDTLLVLVVSPLITLTVVYALLLLRSRIRRRRWRAPKSVVDRLPVRTYHTMSCSSTTSSTRLPSPQSSSPNSPLLQTSPRSTTARSRPRSATASGIGDTVLGSLEGATSNLAKGHHEKERDAPKKRKKYTGRQVECVVCLEEYVDGHSKVMSLPCGHEFHAECM